MGSLENEWLLEQLTTNTDSKQMHSEILKETDITKEYGTGTGHDIKLSKGE